MWNNLHLSLNLFWFMDTMKMQTHSLIHHSFIKFFVFVFVLPGLLLMVVVVLWNQNSHQHQYHPQVQTHNMDTIPDHCNPSTWSKFQQIPGLDTRWKRDIQDSQRTYPVSLSSSLFVMGQCSHEYCSNSPIDLGHGIGTKQNHKFSHYINGKWLTSNTVIL